MKLAVLSLTVAFVLTGCAANSEMAYVPGGSFTMGVHYDGGDVDEKPRHEVELSPYMIGRCEVTAGQFKKFVRDSGYETTAEKGDGADVFVGLKVEKRPDASWRRPYFKQDDSHPAVCVSWYDAVAYCNWRSRAEGLTPCYSGEGDDIVCDFDADGYRLPTEAEWEYAARDGGQDIKYAWGDGEPFIDGIPAGNVRDESAAREWSIKKYWIGYDDGYARTAPVGSFAPNSLGVHDISGNVYEWCWDWYGESYYADSPVVNPTGPAGGKMRSCRDVGFACPIYQECVASRGKGLPDLTFSWGGFRIARSIR